MRRNNGFTLIEMLFSLTMISILLLLVVPSLVSLLKQQETNEFFKLLDADVFYIQNETFATNHNIRILFEGDRYVIRNSQTKEEVVRDFPSHLQFDLVHNRIMFNNNGTILNPTRYRFYDEDTMYEIVFPLGKGRHYIEEYERIHIN